MSISIRESDIAIIGISGRFPGAKDVDAFWQNLRDGVESISFLSNDELSQTDLTLLRNPNYVKAAAVLPNIDLFDASFFGYSTLEAEIIDPQQRIFLECAWEALESAGYNPENYQGLIGIYAGSGMNTYLINNVHPNRGFCADRTFLAGASDLQVRLSNGKDFLPTRVSYKLNLTGPSVNIQTACSTALVAVHLAIQSLLNGECDMALAGGIAVGVPQKAGYLYQEDMIWSNDGHCRAFDAQASGTVFGNGGGIVVLKLLEAAIADGDSIHAVIKGSAINNDGALKVGYTAPSVEGQAAVISEAMAIAQIDPSTLTYVETHGTGTRLGDPIEITALTQAFRQSTDKNGFCAIGSVKTNIGHIAEASGIAGLIKTVLALKHKRLPPSLHFSQPNPNIDFANSPFYVNTTLSEWKANGTPRRAGVSAFGMGGTNCHVVLEEAPQSNKNQESNERPLHILTLSAKTPEALDQLGKRYEVYLKSHPDAELADICFTANAGRKHFNHRLAVTAFSVEQLRDRLSDFGQQTTEVIRTQVLNPQPTGAIAFVFTGQGSQYVDMGRQLYEQAPTFRETLNRCNEILRPYLEQPLLKILYPDRSRENTTTPLDETAYTQPALFALEYALFQLWKSWGIEPDVVMGHSVGEYMAACAAGVLTLEDGLKLIAARGRLMQALLSEGEMVALLTDEARARAAIQPYAQEVSIAAINAQQSIVISGQREAINAICEKLEASGVKTKKLNVSHAFHSPLMEPMLAEFEQVARQVRFSPPQIKLISNVTGKLATEEVATPEYWCGHILQPVRFATSMESLERLGVETLVEIGPSPILLGMASLCVPDINKLWLASLRPEQDDWQVILASLAELYVHGVSVNWLGFDRDYSRRRLWLPTYPFQRQRYWIEASKGYARDALCQNNSVGNQTLHPLLGQQLYLAATQEIQIRFQSQISPDSPFWIREHCLFGTTILPGTAYLEMALAAGAVVAKSDKIWLEDVVIGQAMIWQSDEVKTVQVILTPQSADVYSFEIYSLVPPAQKNQGQPSWTIHTSGKLLIKEKESIAERVDLAALKVQCTQEFPILELYRRFQEQDRNYGSSFRGMEQLFNHETVALGKIGLAEKLIGELEDYQLHPVLLDIALQVMDAICPDQGKQISYVPVGLERLRLCGRPSDSMWSHAQLRNVEGAPNHEQNLSADLQLFADSGELIAVLEGVQLKAVRSDTMLGIPQESWKNWLYEVEWLPQVLNEHSGDDMPDGVMAAPVGAETKPKVDQTKNWLIFADSQGIGQQLVARLRSIGDSCTIVFAASEYEQLASQEFRIDPANPEHFQQLCVALKSVHGVVHGWSLDAPPPLTGEDLEVASKVSCGSALYLVQALAQKYSSPPRLWLLTQGAQAVGVASGVPGLAQSPLWGMGQVIALEHPELNCVLVDLDPKATDAARGILEEITSETSEDRVAFRDGTRYVARLVRSQPEASWLRSESFQEICEQGMGDAASSSVSFREDSSYLITGGLGDLGLLMARFLVERGARHLVLVGRSAVKPAIRSQLEQLELFGAQVVVAQTDVSDYEQVAELLTSLTQSSPPLRGIIHAAGVLDGGLMQQQNWERFARVMAPKVQGAWNLHALTRNKPLDFFVLISSASSLFGAVSQANYAAANAFLDALASYRRAQGLPGSSINWGVWGEVGMAARNQQLTERLNRIGMENIAPHQGLQVLEKLLQEAPVQVGVMSINWSRFLTGQLARSPFFTNFTKVSEQPSKQSVTVEFRQKLEAIPVRERKNLLVDHVSSHIAQVLGWNSSNPLDRKRGFFEMGMDSLTSIELRNRLQTSLGSFLPSTLLFDYPTVEELVNYLVQEVLSALMIPDSDLSANSSIEPEQKAANRMDFTKDVDNNKEKSIDEIAKQLAKQLGLS